MRYIIADIEKAKDCLINLSCHRRNKTVVILNEKEVENNRYLSDYPTLERKAQALGGSVLSLNELKQLINSGGLSI